ncbi:MAG: hypothetical protein K6G13_03000 [Agathobacter sp.]|uniref:sensor histidine kinase n=1 Tax=Agathobacter sp. TaxID=2021311 RepID=UPI00258BF2D5|nr:histidine kinase [Agathobacter sp.]MCR5676983.1 hypothetical protein [Agathobacter sp.]
MREIVEKNLILVSGIILLVLTTQENYIVIASLIGIIETESSIVLRYVFDDKRVDYGWMICCLCISFLWWPLLFFMPVISFSLAQKEKWLFIPTLLLPFAAEYAIDSPFFDRKWPVFTLGILMVLAMLLAYENLKATAYRRQFLNQIDSSVALENKLQQRNAELLASQDDSVRLATLQERNRIAREIHDNVGHMLSRTILQTGALLTIYKEEPLHGQLQSVNDSMNEAMNNIRESVHDLHNDSLDLKRSVEEVLAELRAHYQVDYEYDMGTEIASNVKYCFLAIAKEATANIIKHCDGTKVSVVLREHPGFYQMMVADNGTGKIDREQGGIGLHNMEDRVKAIGGTISFSDVNGFKILLSIPKEQEEIKQ